MALQQGDSITRAYFNSVQSIVATVLGTGTGNTGYGQLVTSSTNPTDPIAAAQWAAVRNDINKCRLHQSGAEFTQNDLPTPVSSGLISAGDHNLFLTAATTIQTNHLVADSGVFTLTPNALSNTRATSWTDTIDMQFIADFGTQDAMRYFLNTGGKIRFVLSSPTSSAPQDQNWNAVLATLGTFQLDSSGLTRSGSGGTITAFNPYVTAANATIFDGTNIGTGAYAANDVYVGIASNPSSLIFTITLQDQHVNSFYDVVSAGTNITVSFLKSTGVMTNITSPTVGLYNSNGF